jgi:hypothetical protein
LLLAACGVTGNFRHDPGYAEFGKLPATKREVKISLGPVPLAIARWVMDDDEAEVQSLLRELRAVRVYTYAVARNEQRIGDGLEQMRAALLADGWLSLVQVREGAELTSVLLRPGQDGDNRGLAVIVHEPAEIVLVNLIGNVRLDFFNDYMAEIDVDAPAIEIDPASLEAHAAQSLGAQDAR